MLVSVARVADVRTAGQGPGEIAGRPAVAVTLAVTNQTTTPLDLGAVAVTATYGSGGTPASSSDGPPAAPLSGTVAPGGAARGTYVLVIPQAQRSAVDLVVSYRAGAPVVLFSGRLG